MTQAEQALAAAISQATLETIAAGIEMVDVYFRTQARWFPERFRLLRVITD